MLFIKIPNILRWPRFSFLFAASSEPWMTSCTTNAQSIRNLGTKNGVEISFVWNPQLLDIQQSTNFICFMDAVEFSEIYWDLKNSSTAFHSWTILPPLSANSTNESFLEAEKSSLTSSTNPVLDDELFFAHFGNNNSLIKIYEVYKQCDSCPVIDKVLCNLENKGCDDVSEFYERRKNLNQMQFTVVGVDVTHFMTNFSKPEGSTQFRVTGGMFGNVFLLIVNDLNATYNPVVLNGYKYGSFKDGAWNGMIGSLARHETDMSASEISMASDRLGVVDFTFSLMTVGRKIYIKKTLENTFIKWGFYTSPFSTVIFGCIIAFSIVFATFLWVTDRFPKIGEGLTVLTLFETSWITISSLCQKGAHKLPIKLSSKLVFIVLQFTFVIIYVGYSATLISQLATAPPVDVPFKGLEGLLKAKGWKGGPVKNDLTQVYMEKTCPELLKITETNVQCVLLVQMWNQMVKEYKEDLPNNFHEGLLRVLQGKFAFVAASTGARFDLLYGMPAEDACNVHEMEGELASSNLAFGLHKGNPFRRILNSKILKLIQGGVVQKLEKTWLPQLKQCDGTSSGYTEVTLYDTASAILICSSGIFLSLFMLSVEKFLRLCTMDTSESLFSKSERHSPYLPYY